MSIKTVLSRGKIYVIRCAVCLALVAAMVGTAELTAEKEIIFPEIAALAVGAVAAPKQSWQTSRIRMVILIAVCSVIGIMLVRYCPLPKSVNLVLAYVLCQVIYMFSGTSFAPLISAAALPVLMGTDTIIYPLSAVSMTILTVIAQYLLEKLKEYEYTEFIPLGKPQKSAYISAIVRTATAAVLAVTAIYMNLTFCVAPPLLVAFTEFTNPESTARSKPVKSVGIITACALCGAVSRYFFGIMLGLPLTVAAVIAMLAVLIIMRTAGQFMPPAAALAILPMIIPQEAVLIYPAEILFGAAVFMAVSKIVFMLKRRFT